tara:strand:+ start:5828 stop:6661 length:834 start_codon:yes stop_codon:yes gene_type:complete
MKFDMKTPLVSINLTTKNRSYFLKECIASILIQTYKNIELIIVDDGSTDDTAKVVDSYKKLLKIRYIRNKYSKGNACARNSALKISNGKYIAFMDDDDFWNDINKITKQVNILEQNNSIDFVFSEIYMLFESSAITKHITLVKPKSWVKHFLTKNSLIYSPTVMIRRSILDLAGGFDEKIKKGVDSALYRKLIIKLSKKPYLMNDPTTTIRIHSGERMTVPKSSQMLINDIFSHYYVLYTYIKYYVTHPIQFLYRFMRLLKACFLYLGYLILRRQWK